ncbi:MAG: DNA-processing protein DprA [Thiolinea sp.]
MNLSEEELRARLQLWRAPGFGGAGMQHLLSYFGSITNALDNSNHELAKAGLKPSKIDILRETKPEDADKDLSWLEGAAHRHIISREDPHYPTALKSTSQPPPLLFAVGNIELLNDPQIAMVGSRSPTSGGKENAHAFASYLAQNGICITSGLALGVDADSHRGALDAGGATIAVVATGMDIIYPARNRKLAERIVENGLIVSEFPIGVRPQAKNFPRRNRIISGLSVGTLVVEAALRSGSLVTARHAMEQGKEVFAIPGSIHNPMARGCHQLIRQGAKLVETAGDILEEVATQLHLFLAPNSGESLNKPSTSQNPPGKPATKKKAVQTGEKPNKTLPEHTLDNDDRLILEALGHDPVPVDQIVLKTGLTTEEVSSMLLMLELQGYVAACGGGHYMQLTPRE